MYNWCAVEKNALSKFVFFFAVALTTTNYACRNSNSWRRIDRLQRN